MARTRGWLRDQLALPSGRGGRFVGASLNRLNGRVNRLVVGALEIQVGDRTLDVGFGGGVGLAALLASPAAHVIGVETSGEMLASAHRRFAGPLGEGRLTLAEGTVEALPLADASVDRILTVNTLYFWPDPQAAARELARVLAPGGRVVVAIDRPEAMERRGMNHPPFRLYDGDELVAVLRSGGLERVRVEEHAKHLFGLAG